MNKFKGYIINLLLIWVAILFYRTNTYYINTLGQTTQQIILFLAIIYTLTGFVKSFNSNEKIKNSILFMIVKIFFLPIMINFTVQNLNFVKNQWPSLISHSSLLNLESFNLIIFPFLLALIFLIDTLWFSLGYTFESRFLKNTIRSVEPTILGWVAALICYPPFNSMFIKYAGWYANDYIFLPNVALTFLLKIVILILLGIYVSATLALGTKCSNLTNRGIVSKGPYSIVRHPAYISKNLVWWITIILFFSWAAFLSMLIWSSIYHIRTITEENHLMRDKDYRKYCKKVKYRYIPYVY